MKGKMQEKCSRLESRRALNVDQPPGFDRRNVLYRKRILLKGFDRKMIVSVCRMTKINVLHATQMSIKRAQ